MSTVLPPRHTMSVWDRLTLLEQDIEKILKLLESITTPVKQTVPSNVGDLSILPVPKPVPSEHISDWIKAELFR